MVETNLERMYRAGKIEIPEFADFVSRASNDFYAALQVFDEQAALAGDPGFLRSMLEIGGVTYTSFRNAVTTLNNCATAVLLSADHYVQTDDGARADLAAMDASLRDLPIPGAAEVPPEVTDPQTPGAVDEDGDVVVTTPEPGSAADDAEERELNEEISRQIHNHENRG
ncbi:hypothetical protein NODU109028_09250 [Nocardioides dubius]|uniref:Uncharacterized protein n=1 Tax=Nocardioides dubius TaxID=317019 RepID=A0ABN1TU47_9ACTN